MKTKFKVHRFDIRMTTDQYRLEEFLNSLEGEVVAVFPNVTSTQLQYASVDFLHSGEATVDTFQKPQLSNHACADPARLSRNPERELNMLRARRLET